MYKNDLFIRELNVFMLCLSINQAMRSASSTVKPFQIIIILACMLKHVPRDLKAVLVELIQKLSNSQSDLGHHQPGNRSPLKFNFGWGLLSGSNLSEAY